ncbi:MAG: hypothetical protein IIU63_02165 [Clostridia bacterium]|nr:hypothetical protein [Clostridia bacterium]
MENATLEKQMSKVQKKPYKRRLGDRADGRLLRTLYPMNKFMPYIMRTRNDACNQFADSIDMTETDPYIRAKVKEGKVNFSFLHVFLAAYVRTLAKRPEINRFVSGNRIYARNNIVVNMTIKTTLSADAPDTCIKVYFEPTDTVDEVYEKFNAAVQAVKDASETKSDKESAFDKTARILSGLPRFVLLPVIHLLTFLDNNRLLPQAIIGVSPFHGSLFVTSMGSLGIRPIYHHLYNFGNLPIFVSYGNKRMELCLDEQGTVQKKRMIDLKVVTDERICDGYLYASAFKTIRTYLEHPQVLEQAPDVIKEDID